MKINMTFNTEVICKRFETGENKEGENTTIQLTLDVNDAAAILFIFSPNIFELSNGYKCIIKLDPQDREPVKNISFIKDDYIYIVLSNNTFLSSILEGYERIRFMEKMSGIVEFTDFESSAPRTDEEDKVIDEFDEE